MMTTQSEQGYSDIYRFAFPKLVSYLRNNGIRNHHDAEDMAAQAMHILWQKWDTFETHTQAGMLRWLLLTAHNLMRDENKRKRRRPQPISLEELTDSDLPFDIADFSQQTEEEYADYIAEIISRLSPNDAVLFRAKIVDCKPDAEIAARLGLSPNTLRVRWLRVKRRILTMWDELKKDT